jgi:hypothetical protein
MAGASGGPACRPVCAALIALAALALAPAAAAARKLHTSARGSGTACTRAKPCGLQTAVERKARRGDNVIVRPDGVYRLGFADLLIERAITLRGRPGGRRPRIVSRSQDWTLRVKHAGARVSDLDLVNARGTANTALWITAGIVDRVLAVSSARRGWACTVTPFRGLGPLLRSSACVATGPEAEAVHAGINPGSKALRARLQNVTALAPRSDSIGVELECSSSDPGGSCRLQARNVIAFGGMRDVTAEGHPNTSVVFDLRGSNFDSAVEGANASVSASNVDANQTELPRLRRAGLLTGALGRRPVVAADLRQRAGSPTENAGIVGGPLGRLDLQRQRRSYDGAPDIGADEIVVTCLGRAVTIVGTGGRTVGTRRADVIVGTPGRDVVVSGGGNDRICTRGGSDAVRAGAGRDRVRAGGARDVVRGGPGADLLYGDGGPDLLLGQAGGDLLIGGPGADRCRGGPGRDRTRRC